MYACVYNIYIYIYQGLPKLLKFKARIILGTNSDFQHVWKKPFVCAKRGRGFLLCFPKRDLALGLPNPTILP